MIASLEQALLTRYKDKIFAYMKEHPEDFEEALQLAVSNQPHLSWRATWLVFHFMKPNDKQVKPYINPFLELFPSLKDGHQREVLKVLSKMNLNDEQEGRVYDFAVSEWEHIKKSPALRYTAFKTMVKMAKKYPELINEIKVLSQPQYINSLSPGIKKSILREMNLLKT